MNGRIDCVDVLKAMFFQRELRPNTPEANEALNFFSQAKENGFTLDFYEAGVAIFHPAGAVS